MQYLILQQLLYFCSVHCLKLCTPQLILGAKCEAGVLQRMF